MWVAWLLHEPDVDGLIQRLTPWQMTEWQAFIALYGLTPDAADFRVAQLGMIVSQGRISVKDLVHKPPWELARVKTAEQVIDQWEAFNVRRAARKRK